MAKRRVIAKNAPPSHTVNFCRTWVVCAPKRLSVIPPPKAAPKPSLRGRCIRTARIISKQTKTRNTSKMEISKLYIRRTLTFRKNGFCCKERYFCFSWVILQSEFHRFLRYPKSFGARAIYRRSGRGDSFPRHRKAPSGKLFESCWYSSTWK